jgi:hypothetical protein
MTILPHDVLPPSADDIVHGFITTDYGAIQGQQTNRIVDGIESGLPVIQ